MTFPLVETDTHLYLISLLVSSSSIPTTPDQPPIPLFFGTLIRVFLAWVMGVPMKEEIDL